MLSRPSLSRITRSGALTSLFVWYISSTGCVLASKHVFSSIFPFPLAVTATNNLVSATLAILAVRMGRNRDSALSSTHESASRSLPRLGRRLPLGFIIGASIGAEIGLSNLSLARLSVTFSTLLKGAAPLSIALWSAAFGLAPLTPQSLGASLALLVGLGLASTGQVEYTPQNTSGAYDTYVGIFLQLAAAMISGLRWTLTQSFMRRTSVTGAPSLQRSMTPGTASCAIPSDGMAHSGVEGSDRSPSETVRATAPYTLLCLLPFVALLEGRAIFDRLLSSSTEAIQEALIWVSCIGVSVFVLLYSEYYLVNKVGAMNVSVLFVAKELLTLIGAKLVFQDRMSLTNMVGFVISQIALGIFALKPGPKSLPLPK